MKNVRIFYTKLNRMRFVSHLDMTRFMTRMLRKAELPIWYTEGFHPHAYITFALPLSLGFESSYEIMDIRLEDDNYPIDEICTRLNAVFPEYVRAFAAAEPILKAGKVAFAKFEITFSDGGNIAEPLKEFLAQPSILCTKKTKKGDEKEIDLIPKIKKYSLDNKEGNTILSIILPAGSNDNINPELLTGAYFEKAQEYYPFTTLRTAILDENLDMFK